MVKNCFEILWLNVDSNSVDILPKLWKFFSQHFDDVGNLIAVNVWRLARPVD